MTDTPEDPKDPSAPPQPEPADMPPVDGEEAARASTDDELAPVVDEQQAPEIEAGAAGEPERIEDPPPPPPAATAPPLPPHVERRVPPSPDAAAMTAPRQGLPLIPIAIIGAIAVALIVGALAWRSFSGAGGGEEAAYVVQPYTPATELITGRDRVEARAEPDAASRIIVIFGEGVTLNVSGRVQRGLGADWYAVSWNGQTAFVREQDVVPGSGAPPSPIVRERPPPEEEKDKDKPDELTDEEEAPVIARPSGALGIGDVNWIREPNARDFARYFPDRALDADQSGNVTLSCIIGGSGRLACSVASETPPGYGFGRAAINISRQLRVSNTLPDGSAAEGRELRLPLSFRAG